MSEEQGRPPGEQPGQPVGWPPPYPPPGYAPPGYAPPGYPQPGYPPQGYPAQGYPAQGYPPPGYPQPGYGPQHPADWGRPPYLPVPSGPPRPSFPHAQPQPYHLMLRTWTYSWWRPVLGIVLVLVGMLVVAPLVMLPVLVVGVLLQGGDFEAQFFDAATLSTVSPPALLYLNLTLGCAILVTWGTIRLLHQMRPRWLSSVGPKIRWRYLFACLPAAVAALVVSVAVGLLLPESGSGEMSGQVNDFTSTTALLALVVLLTTPLQAAGEEYVFRGYVLQALGALTRSSWVAVTLTALVFALFHGPQNFPLFFDRFMFGFIAGWLVVMTGGLEAAIALHVLNNFLAFGFALAFGDITDTLSVQDVGWWNVPVTLAQSATYFLLAWLLARRMGVRRLTQPPTTSPPLQQGEALARG